MSPVKAFQYIRVRSTTVPSILTCRSGCTLGSAAENQDFSVLYVSSDPRGMGEGELSWKGSSDLCVVRKVLFDILV